MHHLPRLCGSNKSLPSSLNPSHPKTTSRAFVPRRRTTSAVAPMTYAQHTRPYERIPERQSSWGGGLPAGVNPPTASPSINTCLMHTDRSDGMPTTKEALTSACVYLFVFDRRALRLVGVLVDPSSIWSRPILCTRSPPFVLRGILAAQSTSVSYSSSLFSAVASPRRSQPPCARKTPCPERSAGILRSASLCRARVSLLLRARRVVHAPRVLDPLGQPANT